MKINIILALLLLSACGGNISRIEYGKTPVSNLVAQKGEPLEKLTPAKSIEIYQYEENEKFQVEDDIVTYGFKNPEGDELALLFWKHKFKDCETITKKMSEPNRHTPPEFELKCAAQGLSVIYTEGSEFVSRVIEYEKK